MRCKACDTLLTDEELKDLDPLTGQPVELCSVCNEISEDAVDDWNGEEL